MALGATPKNIIAVIARSALLPLLAGLLIAGVTALLLSHFLASLLYEINATDPITYVTAAAILLAIGAIASARPARNAAAGDPVRALRME
jgi:ABC-type antimicrobial peptide transport system permease subunit